MSNITKELIEKKITEMLKEQIKENEDFENKNLVINFNNSDETEQTINNNINDFKQKIKNIKI